MKYYYRRVDLLVQTAILVFWLITFFTNLDVFSLMYRLAGAWFFVSLLAHHIISSKKYQRNYMIFLALAITFVAIAAIGIIAPWVFLIEIYVLIWIAPFFAVLYTLNCLAEVRHLTKRPMNYLK